MADEVRLRGTQVTRLETFSDAAFAFAVTLLVITAGELPRSVAELAEDLRAVPAFVASFAVLTFFWAAHYRWSRSYGLETPRAVLLSLALVLVVLIWIYPLRMIMAAFFHWMSAGLLAADFSVSNSQDLAVIFGVYGLGFALLSVIVALLYRHALVAPCAPPLDEREKIRTRGVAEEWLLIALIGATSAGLALAIAQVPLGWVSAAPGIVYFLIGPAVAFADWRARRRLAALEEETRARAVADAAAEAREAA